jgi:hypothetical protein
MSRFTGVTAVRRLAGLPVTSLVTSLSLAATLTLTGAISGSVVATPVAQAAAAGPCDAGGNPVACENTKPGTPSSQWDKASGAGETIEGFTTEFSVNVGETVRFKIRTPAPSYSIDIYRMGYYGGAGARKVTGITPSVPLPQQQGDCATDNTTGLIDCGNWAVSASWPVPVSAVSGIYFAHISRTDGTADDNHIVFVVRNDASHSDMLFQTSDTTWQAYNRWGGNSLYNGASDIAGGRAVKVSYNRPFSTRENTPWGRDFVFANEYPMVRFLEANGYDVSYFSGIDSDRRGALIKNHKTFLSVGHDEYWSGAQRANVEAARDADVHLAFFSGNEVYWKTRWEAASDGTSHRTLVVYKETLFNQKADPAPQWTGTWRDPRFSPPSDGNRPENSLTGTIFTVNCCGVAMTVPAADGKMRFWRDTGIAELAANQTATLPDQTLGYEWDEDIDNGSRPAGLFHMSSTTANVPEKLQDFGTTVAPGTATHHLTLYKAASGALVFGGGTVQWSWGLDPEHDGPGDAPTAADPRMRQATVNLFADMGVQPLTLQTGLRRAVASADQTKPVSTITSPQPAATIANGREFTVTGTATDTGGQVGGVEVSTDGGATWHPAKGRGTWSYTWNAVGAGNVAIKSRAVDDSGNIEIPGAGVTVNVACPCGLFAAEATPKNAAENDATALEAGVKFRPTVDGWVTGVQFYKGSGNTGPHTGSLWSAAGTRLATATFKNETAGGWQSVTFPTPVHLTAGTTYIASYYAPNGHYAADAGHFSYQPTNSPPLIAPQASEDSGNGVYRSGGAGFPTSTFKGGNYWVDVIFDTTEPPDVTAPEVLDAAPYPGSSSNKTSTHPKITFSEPITAGTATLTLKDEASHVVPGSGSFDASRTVLTFAPASPLAGGTTYTLTVGGATDAAGNTMTTLASAFTTAKPSPPPGECPCSIWADDTAPAIEGVQDPFALELGVKFKAETDGFIEGVRFYKGRNNTGGHTGTLWSATGQQLATATFGPESTLGWQEVRFSAKVPVTAGTTYVASYHTTTGWFSANNNGLAQEVANGPLRTIPSAAGGGNGVFKYGAHGFPTGSYQATNYWVDVVYTLPPDTTPPAVTGRSPSQGATSVPVGGPVKVTFSEPVTGPDFTLENAAGNPVSGSAALDSTGKVLTFTPAAPLSAGSTYTARVGGATDAAGNTMPGTSTWSFTTSGACPCTIWPSDAVPANPSINDSGAVELGVKFTANTDGWVSGVRFYKGAGNTGTHTGSLWSAGGTRLATGTFTGESASGWQTLTFPGPVQVQAGAMYVASYHAPNGHYAADGGYFNSGPYHNAPLTALANGAQGGNGVYRYGAASQFPNNTFNGANYWVDAIFSTGQPGDTTPPGVDGVDPVGGQTSVPPDAGIKVTFDEQVQGGTVGFAVTRPDGANVPGTVSYSAATKTATFTPAGPLAWHTEYTARVSGARDAAGNAMTGPHTWSFTTARQSTPGACPCSIWADSALPVVPAANDPGGVELGVKFRADTDGWITGVRFYKGVGNSGTHVGTVWSATGQPLAQATFTGESAAGWQEAEFATPVAVTAGTTYVASYHAPNGHYSYNAGAFGGAGIDRGPLHALQSGVDGPNGVYRYGSGGFPTTGSTTNYWVDVVFTTVVSTTTQP